jgi:Leucine-rich repeat (LRR) protein
MKQLLLFIAVLAFVGCASTPLFDLNANSHVIIEAAIRKEISKPTGELTKADLEKVTSLDIRDRPIKDVGPLANLKQLRSLILEGTRENIDLTPLAKLTQLRSLDLSQGRITDISPLGGLRS